MKEVVLHRPTASNRDVSLPLRSSVNSVLMTVFFGSWRPGKTNEGCPGPPINFGRKTLQSV